MYKNYRLASFLALALFAVISFTYESVIAESGSEKNKRSFSQKAEYVGKEVCAGCHAEQAKAFQNSHHDLAMQHASDTTVVGDFDNAEFTYGQVTSVFFRKNDRYFVNTDGEDGQLRDYEIKFTFGIEPLQQYLIEMPGGRLQALNIVWDTRPAELGGQRWYHLYPYEEITYTDELHWTKISHNWNYMCAECHSTDLHKNYKRKTDAYETTWSEIDVACEACHGPGSRHVALSNGLTALELTKHPDKGLDILFAGWSDDDWEFTDTSSIASLNIIRKNKNLIDSCGRCHARRASMHDRNSYKKSFHNAHILSLLEDGLYYPDGQIDDEVYVYGSFLQSKMYQAGVNCLDCHEPHSLQLRAQGNQLCHQCHKESVYDSKTHHFHETEGDSGRCVLCHMPAKNYMVIDSRRDHSFRIPRPDLTIKTGSPNACNQCHQDKTSAWAMQHVNEWYQKDEYAFHYAEALHAARTGAANAESLMLKVINDDEMPAIARSTALRELATYLNSNTFHTMYEATGSDSILLRLSSIDALSGIDIADRHKLLKHLLVDDQKSIRISAANILAPAVNIKLSEDDRDTLIRAIEEYKRVQLMNGERAFAHTNLANLYQMTGQLEKAEKSYLKAISLEVRFIPAYINLADLYRLMGNEKKVEEILSNAVSVNDNAAVVYNALGLSYVRQKKTDLALDSLKKASLLEPDNGQYILIYAIALNSMNKTSEALAVLENYLLIHPRHGRVLTTLSTINRDQGNIRQALFYANQYLEVAPDNVQMQQYAADLKKTIN